MGTDFFTPNFEQEWRRFFGNPAAETSCEGTEMGSTH
jgi:hypothetical protein